MRIGELAAQAGTSRDAIRFYERVGIVRGRRLANGYRDFPPEALTRLRHVRTAQALGFSLAEIARLGDELGGVPDPADELSARLQDRIRAVDARLAELTALRAELSARVGTRCPLRARMWTRAAAGRTAEGGCDRG